MQFFYIQKTKYILLLTFLLSFVSPPTLLANENFFDFLPRYRKYKSHYQIDKIHYKDKRTIIYFRFVVQKNGSYTFFGNNHPNSWYLRTPRRMRGVEIQFKQLEMRNIKVNNEEILHQLSTVPDISYELTRGDVITYEVHFVRIPYYIRMLDMIEGKDGAADPSKFNCFDILVKSQGNPLLGTIANSKQIVSKFEQNFTYIQPKINKEDLEISPEDQVNPVLISKKNTAKTNSLEQEKEVAPEPINYTPAALESIEDFSCNQRVILPNVKFKDNEINFLGRVKSMQNIRIVYDYLMQYNKSTINLYGHTDIFGNKHKSINLSRERAFAVKRELIQMGIDSDRITVYFYGGEHPLPEYKEGSPENRRVEVQPICHK